MSRALCADLTPQQIDDVFFDNTQSFKAKAFCRRCPNVADCLILANRNGGEYWGTWGGEAAPDRRRRLALKLNTSFSQALDHHIIASRVPVAEVAS